ncbi:H-NS histone family protein [Lysobacter stagni]|uniref:H-NS histone family protein n=1 Tax=Lysobacter stagni TaxID=3045172 RepID=UPI0031F33605
MSINLDSLSAKELDALINQAKKRKTTLSKRKPVAVIRKKLTQLARAEGYTIAELFGGGSAPAPRAAKPAKKAVSRRAGKPLGKVAPKYRNPANAAETWAGRGKQPRWLAAYTDAGRKLEDFLIR